MRTFLEAHQVLRDFAGGPPLPFLFGMSGTADPLLIFLRAAAAERGREALISVLPFNTLGQTLSAPVSGSEVLLVCPWDLVPELDWRSGLVGVPPNEAEVRARATETLESIRQRSASLLYVAAPVPPLTSDPARDAALMHWLEAEMRFSGATVLAPEGFSLQGYLATGCPIASPHLHAVAESALEALIPRSLSAKVLVTDLDNTLWAGVIGDDGPEGIAAGPHGRGFPHFLVQSLLRRLREEGVLIAAVTKNDPDVALAPFRNGGMLLREDDFIAFLASWHPKSAQIRELADKLNLGLDAFVFIDDNPLELEEVSLALPSVTTVRFPAQVSALPGFLGELRAHFRRADLTEEDRTRTSLYRRRLEGMAPTEAKGADLTAFLRDLRMVLRIADRTNGDRTRAVQLINKTNQFNLNGERLSDDEIREVLAAGGKLYGATLEDRTGSHGEILACLIDRHGEVRSLVLSCRVFQRRVEHAFLAWLAQREPRPQAFRFRSTERNGPLRVFLADIGPLESDAGLLAFDANSFSSRHGDALSLFRLEDPAAEA